MRKELVELVGQRKLDDPMPRMVLEDVLDFSQFRKMKQRQSQRVAVKLMKEFDAKVADLSALFFKYAQDPREDDDLKKYLLQLDEQWKAWLRDRYNFYKVTNCRDFFATKLSYLIEKRKKETEAVLAKVLKDDEQK